MAHRRKHRRKRGAPAPGPVTRHDGGDDTRLLEIVVKADTAGVLEAVCGAISELKVAGVEIVIVQRGVGEVTQGDLLQAETGSKLILGFSVPVGRRLVRLCAEHGVEIRLYEVIYALCADLVGIARSLLPAREEADEVTGSAKVIALFKSSRHGIILGCRVEQGLLRLGDSFRLISAMGPVYSGVIRSLHIEQDAVKMARPGQEVGLQIKDFHQAREGDIVECFRRPKGKGAAAGWQPTGQVIS
ncbi:MAG: hypothetical protein ABFR97_03165 [Thermodesulfobacteriota bacterium]